MKSTRKIDIAAIIALLFALLMLSSCCCPDVRKTIRHQHPTIRYSYNRLLDAEYKRARKADGLSKDESCQAAFIALKKSMYRLDINRLHEVEGGHRAVLKYFYNFNF